jgi:outer membrane lipoprotein LolB
VTAARFAAWPCLAAAVLIAAGCAVAPLRPVADDPRAAFEERAEAMAGVDQWELRGRLAVKTGRRGETISMFWRREGRSDHYINLYGPMGAGRVILTQDAGGAELRDNEGQSYYDDSAEKLLYQVAGWRVPFQSLQHWVLGVPAPDSDYDMELDGWGRLTSLTQNGWRIRFQEYHYIEGQDMPRRLVMNALPGTDHIVGGSAEDEDIQVKALIKSWDWAGN